MAGAIAAVCVVRAFQTPAAAVGAVGTAAELQAIRLQLSW